MLNTNAIIKNYDLDLASLLDPHIMEEDKADLCEALIRAAIVSA